jgi:hypothetical protein
MLSLRLRAAVGRGDARGRCRPAVGRRQGISGCHPVRNALAHILFGVPLGAAAGPWTMAAMDLIGGLRDVPVISMRGEGCAASP